MGHSPACPTPCSPLGSFLLGDRGTKRMEILLASLGLLWAAGRRTWVYLCSSTCPDQRGALCVCVSPAPRWWHCIPGEQERQGELGVESLFPTLSLTSTGPQRQVGSLPTVEEVAGSEPQESPNKQIWSGWRWGSAGPSGPNEFPWVFGTTPPLLPHWAWVWKRS